MQDALITNQTLCPRNIDKKFVLSHSAHISHQHTHKKKPLKTKNHNHFRSGWRVETTNHHQSVRSLHTHQTHTNAPQIISIAQGVQMCIVHTHNAKCNTVWEQKPNHPQPPRTHSGTKEKSNMNCSDSPHRKDFRFQFEMMHTTMVLWVVGSTARLFTHTRTPAQQ